ncbi:ATP-binding protein, partial [Paralimibaculum aggregatum]|uniref:ATP-binding protein n=1 Tax=Paralimibaculum aggregatum TaxID=3036245 RepID=UPI003DA09B9D
AGPAEARTAGRAALSRALAACEEDRLAAEARQAALAAEATDPALAAAAVARGEKALGNLREEAGRLATEIAKLRGRLERAAAEGLAERVAALEGRVAAARGRRDRVQAECMALARLKSALEAAGAAARARYFAPLERELEPLLELVYGGAALEFGAESLAPVGMVRGGQREPLGRLSGGTREQIAILTRLAFARLLARGGTAPPVILDDALIFSDDDRIEAMFTVLAAQMEALQIIVFTCRQRAFAGLGGNLLRLEPWTPAEV